MFAIVDMATKQIARKQCADMVYATERGAKIVAKKMNAKSAAPVTQFVVMTTASFNKYLNPMVERVNIMSGKTFKEPRNTPYFCSPSSETYWSM
jgi:hypothetical protein